jgi:hypothetical protein
VLFPRSAARRSDAQQRREVSDNSLRPTRATSEASLVTWLDVKRLRDAEDDGDGGGGSAA